jgi:Ca2+-binding RTX toxin-like protein
MLRSPRTGVILVTRSAAASRLLLAACAAAALVSERAGAAYTAEIIGTTLVVTGDASGGELVLRARSGGLLLDLELRPDGIPDFTFDRALFASIDVFAGPGNDTVRVDESQAAFTDTEALAVDGGPGRDVLIGGVGPEVLVAGDDDDVVDGNGGIDVILLGEGNDLVVWSEDGNDTVNGEAGDDRFALDGTIGDDRIIVFGNSGGIRISKDVGIFTVDLDGVETIDIATIGGTDFVNVVETNGTDLRLVNVELEAASGSGTPDGEPDTITVLGGPGQELVAVETKKGALTITGLFTETHVDHAEPDLDVVAFVGTGPDTLSVNGTKKTDIATIAPSPVIDNVRTDFDTYPAPIDVSGTVTLFVNGLGGADSLTSSGLVAAPGFQLVLDGGKGNDTVTGGLGNEILFGGSGKDTVRGGDGDDTAFLGPGADVFTWNPGDDNDTVEGQAGLDTLQFNGANVAENIDVSPVGERARFFRDVANVTMDLNDVEQVSYAALGGADTVVVNDLTGTEVKGVIIDLAGTLGGALGDAQIDAIVVNGTAGADKINVTAGSKGVSVARKLGAVRIAHAEPTDTLTINGLAGVDKIKASASAFSAMALTINED